MYVLSVMEKLCRSQEHIWVTIYRIRREIGMQGFVFFPTIYSTLYFFTLGLHEIFHSLFLSTFFLLLYLTSFLSLSVIFFSLCLSSLSALSFHSLLLNLFALSLFISASPSLTQLLHQLGLYRGQPIISLMPRTYLQTLSNAVLYCTYEQLQRHKIYLN